jgi:hypothetical protein
MPNGSVRLGHSFASFSIQLPVEFAFGNEGGTMKPTVVVALASTLSMLLASSAIAQTTMTFGTPQPSAFGSDPIIRISTTFRTMVSADGQTVADSAAQETARRTL